jgi:hypothetical protein
MWLPERTYSALVTLTPAPDRAVARSRILAALERFERAWAELVDASSDRGCWTEINAELDALRSVVGACPELATEFGELIMRHAQVLRSLTKPSDPGVKAAELAALRLRHKGAIDALRTKCSEAVR